jgi:hypothetical protein
MKNVKKLAIMTLAIMLVGILLTGSVSSIACKKQPQYPLLLITAPSSVNENQQFMVRITANNQSVVGANVVFNGITKQTNLNGTVNFIAPEVNITHSFTISASKTGYISATASILVINIPQYPQLVINAPSSVYENQQFTVQITANNQPVASAHVVFNGINKLTNSNGATNFLAPEVNMTHSFSVFAYKSGYLNATSSILVINIPQYPQLVINAPSSVYEGQDFLVTITAGNQSVAGAYVVFNDITEQTNLNGTVYFTAPYVNMTQSFTIFAYKYGYLNDTASITVYIIDPYQLVIQAPSEVMEGEIFSVIVTIGDGQPFYYATVSTSWNETDDWGLNGYCFTAPEVEYTENFTITASFPGYQSDTVFITVINQPAQQLVISAPSFAYEYQPFLIGVTSGNNSIPGATVTISAGNHTYYTNYTNSGGFVLGYISGIQQTTNMTITASKIGYLTATKMIVIINQ